MLMLVQSGTNFNQFTKMLKQVETKSTNNDQPFKPIWIILMTINIQLD